MSAPTKFPVGVLIGGNDLPEALARVAGDGGEIVQIWCTSGTLAPENFNAGVADAVLVRCERLGLKISALCGDTGLGFTNPEKVAKSYELTVSYLKVCRALGVKVLTSHIGHFTGENGDKARATGIEWLRRLGDAAAKQDVTFASETGAEDGPNLRQFLADLDHPNIKANFDPANMLMRGFDLEQAVRMLSGYIAHSHAKDATFKGGEKPIGAGDVPWPTYLGWLEKAGYTGPLAIEREGGNTFRDDCRQGMGLIKRWRGCGHGH
ncbi:MAG: sugar phosphate isomerase/epimerase [Planctomycetota bacterium]|nr:sugar phosphate isomerase/epimerase [Planctomycetota bacterium]